MYDRGYAGNHAPHTEAHGERHMLKIRFVCLAQVPGEYVVHVLDILNVELDSLPLNLSTSRSLRNDGQMR